MNCNRFHSTRNSDNPTMSFSKNIKCVFKLHRLWLVVNQTGSRVSKLISTTEKPGAGLSKWKKRFQHCLVMLLMDPSSYGPPYFPSSALLLLFTGQKKSCAVGQMQLGPSIVPHCQTFYLSWTALQSQLPYDLLYFPNAWQLSANPTIWLTGSQTEASRKAVLPFSRLIPSAPSFISVDHGPPSNARHPPPWLLLSLFSRFWSPGWQQQQQQPKWDSSSSRPCFRSPCNGHAGRFSLPVGRGAVSSL